MGTRESMLQKPFIGKVLLSHRFIKFGAVGFSGTLINLSVLYLNQEYFFRWIESSTVRLHLSLAGAIFLATLSNYIWNRGWTWRDRKRKARYGFVVQMGRYFLASALSIGIQYLCTIGFSQFIHYLMANVLSIGVAATLNYLVNDVWTFAVRGKRELKNKAFQHEGVKICSTNDGRSGKSRKDLGGEGGFVEYRYHHPRIQ